MGIRDVFARDLTSNNDELIIYNDEVVNDENHANLFFERFICSLRLTIPVDD